MLRVHLKIKSRIQIFGIVALTNPCLPDKEMLQFCWNSQDEKPLKERPGVNAVHGKSKNALVFILLKHYSESFCVNIGQVKCKEFNWCSLLFFFLSFLSQLMLEYTVLASFRVSYVFLCVRAFKYRAPVLTCAAAMIFARGTKYCVLISMALASLWLMKLFWWPKFLLHSRNTCHKSHKNQAGCFVIPYIAQLREPGIKGYSAYTTTLFVLKFCA